MSLKPATPICEFEEKVQEALRRYTPYLQKYQRLLNRLEEAHLIDEAERSQIETELAKDRAALNFLAAIARWKFRDGEWMRIDLVSLYGRRDIPGYPDGLWVDGEFWQVYLDRWERVSDSRWHY